MQNQALELTVRITLRPAGQFTGQGLELSETAVLDTAGFLEAAKILGLFHDLVEQLRAGNAQGGKRG